MSIRWHPLVCAALSTALLASGVSAATASPHRARSARRQHQQKHHPRIRASEACFMPALPGDFAPSVPAIVADARQDAKRLIQTVLLPAGTRRETAIPAASKELKSPPQCPATPDLIDFYDLWRGRGEIESVISWIRSHPPQGSVLAGVGMFFGPPAGATGPSRLTSEFVWFSWPAVSGISESRSLLVLAVPLADNRLALRVDSQVMWLNPRPASEQVPSGVNSVSVAFRHDDGSTASYTATDSSQVAQIIAWTNALPADQPTVHGCAGGGTDAKVTFSAQDGGTLAAADADGACGGVTFSIEAQPQPQLTGADDYINDLESLFGAGQS